MINENLTSKIRQYFVRPGRPQEVLQPGDLMLHTKSSHTALSKSYRSVFLGMTINAVDNYVSASHAYFVQCDEEEATHIFRKKWPDSNLSGELLNLDGSRLTRLQKMKYGIVQDVYKMSRLNDSKHMTNPCTELFRRDYHSSGNPSGEQPL